MRSFLSSASMIVALLTGSFVLLACSWVARLAVPESPPALDPAEAGVQDAMAVQLTYQVGADVARRLGWVGAEASDEEAGRVVAAFAAARLHDLVANAKVEAQDGFLTVEIEQPLTEAGRKVVDASLRSMGGLEFAIVAADTDELDPPTGLHQERARLAAWMEANPGVSLARYNLVPHAEGGPHPDLFVAARRPDDTGSAPSLLERAMFLLRPDGLAESFTGGALEKVTKSTDGAGFPALGFEFTDERKPAFLEFTGRFEGRRIAILLGGEVHSAPTIAAPLLGVGIIQGQFSEEDVDGLLRTLRSDTQGGPLRPVRAEDK